MDDVINVPSCSSVNQQNDEENPTDTEKILEDLIPGYKSIEDITKPGFRSMLEATSCSNSLPTGHDWDLYTSYPSFLPAMNAEGNEILDMIHMVLQHQGIPGNILKRPIDEKLDLISDANDTILERVGMHLDELDGIRRKPEPILIEAEGYTTTKVVSGSWNKQNARSTIETHEPSSVRLLTARNIERPQAKFKDKVDNTNTPYEPRIKDKPNSLKPLAILVEETVLGEECFSHPYDYELDRFAPTASQLAKVAVVAYKPLEETPLVMVSSPEQLPALVEDLERYSEISVDLEHHSYRTFLGITCLMQISTRDTDYIIDTLALRDSIHCLNQVFTKPAIVKVLHGASHDIEWLQRDLCLYIVNMFDTQHAAKLLNVAPLSLAYLLSKYCNVNVNKRFQLADWRIRPLPEELLTYARGDTHYLLYVHDIMKNALIDAALGQDNLLASVYQRGVDLCKTRYIKPIWREDSYLRVYQNSRKMFDNRQLYALREIYNWRDTTARLEDESTGYVLPNHMLLHISETLPREMQGILACCNPIPPLVRQNLVLIHQIILKARDQPLVKLIEENRPSGRRLTWAAKLNVESSLHCPHDLTKLPEFRDDLPTLLDGLPEPGAEPESGSRRKRRKTSHVDVLLKEAPEVTVFETEAMFTSTLAAVMSDRLKQVKFVSPYERCKLVQPFMQAQEEEEVAKAKAEASNPDQERIDRIKEHFIQESQRLKQSTDGEDLSEEPLRNQGKASKRKRAATEERLVKGERPVKAEQLDEPAGTATAPKVEPGGQEPAKVNRKKLKAKHQRQQESFPFKPFDYSQVDFNRFKGGSEQTSQQKESKDKNKKKKKSGGKSNNKSFTFGKGRK